MHSDLHSTGQRVRAVHAIRSQKLPTYYDTNTFVLPKTLDQISVAPTLHVVYGRPRQQMKFSSARMCSILT